MKDQVHPQIFLIRWKQCTSHQTDSRR